MIHFAISICLLISVELIGPTEAADCSTVTCYNGGTCNNHTVSPPCLCPLPYIAPYCESAADYCFTLQPDKNITELPVCLHEGTCTLAYTDPYFNCSCLSNYTGSRCEVPVGDEEETTEFSTTTETTAAAEQSTAREQSQISTVVIIVTACGAGLLFGAAILVGVCLIRSRRHKKPQIKETVFQGNSNIHAPVCKIY